jgi:hypothetical protein
MSHETEKTLEEYPQYGVDDSVDEESHNLLPLNSLTESRKPLIPSLLHILALYSVIAILSIVVIVLIVKQGHYDPSLAIWCKSILVCEDCISLLIPLDSTSK